MGCIVWGSAAMGIEIVKLPGCEWVSEWERDYFCLIFAVANSDPEVGSDRRVHNVAL